MTPQAADIVLSAAHRLWVERTAPGRMDRDAPPALPGPYWKVSMDMSLILLIAAGGFLLFVVGVVVAVVLVVVVRRPGPRPSDLAHRPSFSTPLDRAKAAALELTADEWVQFRLWVEGPRTPPAGHGEGFTQ